LAARLGLPLRVARTSLLEIARAAAQGIPAVDVTIVGTSSEASDDLLTGLMADVHAALSSEIPWSQLPRFTLLVARDLASLSWVIAKAIATSVEPRAGAAPGRFRHYQVNASGTHAREALIDDATGWRPDDRQLRQAELLASLLAPTAATAYQTHGADGCAHGGDGLVLCGLRLPSTPLAADTPGTLACGRGHPCPRGPLPLALERVPTTTLMLASCNSLRLANSSHAAAFNLGLSFLEGIGQAYAGSITSGFTNEACSLSFISAYSSGWPFGEATLLANALLTSARLDTPSYLGVGLPGTRAPEPFVTRGEPIEIGEGARSPIVVQAGSTFLAELLVRDANLVALARVGTVSISATGAAGNAVFWLARVEHGGANSDMILRVFLFGFPEPLGDVTLSFEDAETERERTRHACANVGLWTKLGRLALPGEPYARVWAELTESAASLRARVVEAMPSLLYDGRAPGLVRQLGESLDALSDVARETVTTGLVERMTGSFWLTNVLSSAYHPVSAERVRCPYCAGAAEGKLLRHGLDADARRVVVCLRCGIVEDVPEGAALTVAIDAPVTAHAGGSLEVTVRLARRSDGDGQEVTLWPRMPSRGGRDVLPEPRSALASAAGSADFRFQLPADMLPHQYPLKVLVASRHGLGFAQRPLFVI
jgi:hypothetical protein